MSEKVKPEDEFYNALTKAVAVAIDDGVPAARIIGEIEVVKLILYDSVQEASE